MTTNAMTKYYTYIIRCEDNSLYTGITTDVNRRMTEHFTQSEKCAKYTRTHKAKYLAALWRSESRVKASQLEYRIKRLTKAEKEKLIFDNDNTLFGGKLDLGEFTRVRDLRSYLNYSS